MPTTATKNKVDTNDTSYADISAIYDRIYDIADRLFKKHNPCNIHIKNKIVLCNEFPHIENNKFSQQCNSLLCCGGCKHKSMTGCTIKCLPCKLFFCSYIRQYNEKLSKRLLRLKRFTAKQGIDTRAYFHTKSEVLEISENRRKKNLL